jgi:hypothetical protein
MRVKIEESIIDKIFQIEKKDLSRIIWIATITNSSNSGKNRLNILHKKLETIIEGGLKDFSIKDVSIIVWSMCCMRYKPEGKFWNNM